jgi:hypothetical protein
MMNSLLFTPAEGTALKSGTEDDRRTELMTQTIAGFELINSPKADHLMPRLQVMYRILLRDPSVTSRIALECEGFDFEREFNGLVGIPLERWLFVIFAIYTYFLNGANPLDPHPEFMLINPENFCGESGITRAELDTVLATISIPTAELKSAIENETSTTINAKSAGSSFPSSTLNKGFERKATKSCGIQFLECRRERIGEIPDGSRPEFLVLWL